MRSSPVVISAVTALRIATVRELLRWGYKPCPRCGYFIRGAACGPWCSALVSPPPDFPPSRPARGRTES